MTTVQTDGSEATTVESIVESVRSALFVDSPQSADGIRIEGTSTEYGADLSCTTELGADGRYLWQLSGVLQQSHGFDGCVDWEQDITGMVRQLDLGDLEEARLRHWLTSGEWVRHTERLQITALDSESPQSWRLGVALRDGRMQSTVDIEKASALPQQFTVTGIQGVEDYRLLDFRKSCGRQLPFHVQKSNAHGDVVDQRVLNVQQVSLPLTRFRMPELPTAGWTMHKNGAELPLKRADTGHVLVQVDVNETGPRWFIFDTGAGGLAFGKHLAKETESDQLGTLRVASVFGVDQSPVSRFQSVRVGPLEIQNPVAVQLDLSGLDEVFGERIEGVIGYEVFARCVAVIDAAGPTVRLYKSAPPGLDESGWLPLRMNWRLPLVSGRLENYPEGLYRIDIGASGGPFGNVAFHSPFVDEYDVLRNREVSAIDAPPHELRTGTISRFELAHRVFPDADAAFALTDVTPFNDPFTQGNIGIEFLKNFRIVLDYRNRRFRMDPAGAD